MIGKHIAISADLNGQLPSNVEDIPGQKVQHSARDTDDTCRAFYRSWNSGNSALPTLSHVRKERPLAAGHDGTGGR